VFSPYKCKAQRALVPFWGELKQMLPMAGYTTISCACLNLPFSDFLS